MLERLREIGYRSISPVVSLAINLKISPNQISFLSFISTVIASFLLYYSSLISYIIAPLFIILDGLLDIVDGEVARKIGKETNCGDFLDHSLDRYKDTILIIGITGGIGEWKLGFFALSGILLTAYMGTGAQAIGQKRMYAGILTRSDFLAILTITPLLQLINTISLKIALILISIGGILTAIQRFIGVWRSF